MNTNTITPSLFGRLRSRWAIVVIASLAACVDAGFEDPGALSERSGGEPTATLEASLSDDVVFDGAARASVQANPGSLQLVIGSQAMSSPVQGQVELNLRGNLSGLTHLSDGIIFDTDGPRTARFDASADVRWGPEGNLEWAVEREATHLVVHIEHSAQQQSRLALLAEVENANQDGTLALSASAEMDWSVIDDTLAAADSPNVTVDIIEVDSHVETRVDAVADKRVQLTDEMKLHLDALFQEIDRAERERLLERVLRPADRALLGDVCSRSNARCRRMLVFLREESHLRHGRFCTFGGVTARCDQFIAD